ncbi:MAG: hypothetical protein AAF429_01135, partial [Pseudomonadota bacterium]
INPRPMTTSNHRTTGSKFLDIATVLNEKLISLALIKLKKSKKSSLGSKRPFMPFNNASTCYARQTCHLTPHPE